MQANPAVAPKTASEDVPKNGPTFVHRQFGLERMLDETLDLYDLQSGPEQKLHPETTK